MNLEPCNIYLDAGLYQFHKSDKKPSASSKKEDILKWLADKGHDISSGIGGGGPTKSQLTDQFWEKCINIGYDYAQNTLDETQSTYADAHNEPHTDKISNEYWLKVLKSTKSYDARLKVAVESLEIN
ncbi:hypothetical protein FBU30_009154 [Linnemannia zychae]|nr:hypothetical protein FBU30_009154 [Linnemannia zychae]